MDVADRISRDRAIEALFAASAQERYGLAPVSQLEHALQSAQRARESGGSPSFVAAALLHDVGHLLQRRRDLAAAGIDDRHEGRGAAWLARSFGPAVTEPIRLHVAAKRYLCATDPTYGARLAPDSVRSLALQGGPMSDLEARAFEREPFFADAVALRRIDEAAKEDGAPTPPLAFFLERLPGPDGAA